MEPHGAVYFAHGLCLGALLAGFIFFMGRK